MKPPDRAGAIALSLPAGPAVVERDFLHLGQFQREGRSLQVNSRYLELDGRPWIPVMGEFHYSRYPEGEWQTELRKMQAGGGDVVASYVFWNHHEDVEGRFDWSGRRDVRRFVELAARVGLFFFLRVGPWVHGEARNGGFPDWLLATGELRCNDPGYLARVARLYREIGAQLGGLMWRDGGPVIGVQLENEYPEVGPGRGAEHIAELERLAIAAGLTVPLYTVTGWPTLDIPPREVIPVSGAYADGFWFGETGPRAPSGVFLFQTSRAIGEMGAIGGTPAEGLIDRRHYPFFLAEAGGGMQVSYHRRPVVDMDDVAATPWSRSAPAPTCTATTCITGARTLRAGPAGSTRRRSRATRTTCRCSATTSALRSARTVRSARRSGACARCTSSSPRSAPSWPPWTRSCRAMHRSTRPTGRHCAWRCAAQATLASCSSTTTCATIRCRASRASASASSSTPARRSSCRRSRSTSRPAPASSGRSVTASAARCCGTRHYSRSLGGSRVGARRWSCARSGSPGCPLSSASSRPRCATSTCPPAGRSTASEA